MTISLENQSVLVVGGARRIGKAVALECARAGASVAITFRRSHDDAQQTLEELREIGGENAKFAAFALEISDANAVSKLADTVFAEFANLRGLVNCAAIFERTPPETLSESDFDAHLSANLKGPFLLCQTFGKRFFEAPPFAPNAENPASVVLFSDVFAQRPLANYIPYCASKAGVEMLCAGFAKAWAPRVRVNCIAPGTIAASDENFEADLLRRIPFGRAGTSEEIAQTALFLLGGPQFITGTTIRVDGGQFLR